MRRWMQNFQAAQKAQEEFDRQNQNNIVNRAANAEPKEGNSIDVNENENQQKQDTATNASSSSAPLNNRDTVAEENNDTETRLPKDDAALENQNNNIPKHPKPTKADQRRNLIVTMRPALDRQIKRTNKEKTKLKIF